MINYPALYDQLRPYRIALDSEMPWPYRFANPEGRPFHDDWLVARKTPRIDTAYKVPLPFKWVAGSAMPEWIPNPAGYPVISGEPVKNALWTDEEGRAVNVQWVRTMTPIHPPGQWSRQAAFIGGRWVECFYSRSMSVMGRKVIFYHGLRLDPHPRDTMCWFPEISASIKWRGND